MTALVAALITYFAVVQPIQRSNRIPHEEKEIFVLTGTLLWGIMIQVVIAYLTTTSPHTVRPLVTGITAIGGVRTPTNEILTAVLEAGLTVTGFVEHQSIPWQGMPGQMHKIPNGEWQLTDRPQRLPHSYTLQAVRNAV